MGAKVNHKPLQSKDNVLSIVNRNELHQCSMLNKKYNGDIVGFEFCWVHGIHIYANWGRHYITVFTYFNDFPDNKKQWKKPFYERMTEVYKVKYDKIRITEIDTGIEREFEVPRELVVAVAKTLELKHLWVRYAMRFGLTTKLAFHLAKRAEVYTKTDDAIQAAWRKVSERTSEIHWDWDYEKGKYVRSNKFTYQQSLILDAILWKDWLKDRRAIENEHYWGIQEQNDKLKIRVATTEE